MASAWGGSWGRAWGSSWGAFGSESHNQGQQSVRRIGAPHLVDKDDALVARLTVGEWLDEMLSIRAVRLSANLHDSEDVLAGLSAPALVREQHGLKRPTKHELRRSGPRLKLRRST